MREIVKMIEKIEFLGEFEISVCLPSGYHTSRKDFPVIYMHDGQNLFNDKDATYGYSWNIIESLDKRVHKTFDFIVVGIHHRPTRLDDYAPWKNDPKFANRLDRVYGGQGDAYVDFIVHTLKPKIDQTYRTLSGFKYTSIAGSSMGGYISLYAIAKYPDVFKFAGLFSTSLWFNYAPMIDYVKSSLLSYNHYIFISVGTQETSEDKKNQDNIRYVKDSMKVSHILEDLNVHTRLVVQDEKHHESSWRKQFPLFLEFMTQSIFK